MSFQRELESTGADSKQKQRYERFAVIAPCKSMDPETEFDLKYESAEDALQLARKVHQKFDASIFKSKAFAVQLMGASILKMNGDQSAWEALLNTKAVPLVAGCILRKEPVGYI